MNSVLTPIERRTPLEVRGAPAVSAQLRDATATAKPGAAWLLARSIWWLGAGLLLSLRLGWDALRGRRSPRNFARRLRQTFEEAGGAAAKLGQELSLRVDIFPIEICEELGKIRAATRPLDTRYVVDRLEAAARQPLAAVFSTLDPNPIHDGMTSAVYQGILRRGTRVAVKVRRPGVAERVAADLRCIEWLTYLPELLTMVKPAFFQQLREGLRQIMVDEVDLAREARYQRLFRVWAKKARFDWLSAPRVFTKVSSMDVLVSEYVDGLLCSELLGLVERDDGIELGELASAGITPRRVARRLFQLQFWSFNEALFFPAAPHAADIVILPDSKLVVRDFGSAGTMSANLRRNVRELNERALASDAAGMSEVALLLLAPLPHIDVYELKKAIEASFHTCVFALRDKRAHWIERAPMSIWIALMNATRLFSLPVHLDVLRIARASVLYDSIAFRLARLKFTREYRRYRRQARRRATRRLERRAMKATPREVREEAIVGGAHLARLARHAEWTARAVSQQRPVQMTGTVRKASYVALALLSFIARVGVIVGIAIGVAFGWHAATGTALALKDVARHPVVIALILLNVWILLRRVAFRLNEHDPRNDGQTA